MNSINDKLRMARPASLSARRATNPTSTLIRLGILSALSLGMSSASVAASAAQPLTGTWLMQNRKAEVQIYSCGQNICGRVSKILKYPKDGARSDIHNSDRSLRDRPLVGMPVLLNFEPNGQEFKGKVYDPKSGRNYGATLTQQGRNTLTIKACVLVICKSQEWTRIR